MRINVYRVCQFLLFSALILTLNVGCERPYTQGKYAFFWEMYDTIPYDAFDENPVTPDGKTLMKPVKGTIPRGYMPYHYKKTPQDAARAGRELKSPIKKTRANLKRGKRVYETFCLVCHGPTGAGDGPIIPKFPAPQPFSSPYMKSHPAGRIYHVVTVGSFLMGSYASQISSEDRWKLVQYVQQLQRGGK